MPFSLASWDPAHPGFEPKRYWRGPIWAVVNFLVALGLSETGRPDLVARVTADTRKLIEREGFYEYFDPVTGAGLGGGDFSWTAAMWLAWCGRRGDEEDG